MWKNNYINPNINQRIASNPNNNVWVSASAGTGKTKILIDRLLRLMLDGTSIDKILCITFTKVAAQEMINRLMVILAKWSILEDDDLKKELYLLTNNEPNKETIDLAKRLFSDVLDQPEAINIQTIHSFCQNILSKFPLEANVPSNFTVVVEDYERELKKQAIDSILSMKLYESPKNHKIKNILTNIVTHISSNSFDKRIFEILSYSEELSALNKHYNMENSLENFKKELYKQLNASLNINSKQLENNFFATTSFPQSAFYKIANILKEKNLSSKYFNPNDILEFLELSHENKIYNKKKWKLFFLTTTETPRKTILSVENKKHLNDQEISFIETALENELNRLIEFNEKYKNQVSAEINLDFIALSLEIYNQYQEIKKISGLLDFNDLIIKTKELLEKSDVIPWIMYKLDQKISHILVDEAQDTNKSQWEIIKYFVEEFFSGISANEENRTLFVVGDIKQSIYSFQGADPNFFKEIQMFFKNKITTSKKNWHQIPMSVSFRSSSGLISAINQIVNNLFSKKTELYKEEELEHFTYDDKKPANVEIWPLLCNITDENHQHHKHQNHQNLAKSIVKKIKYLNEKKNIAFGDVLILYRKRSNNHTLDYLVKFLKDANIPVLGVDKINLNNAIAVMDLIALIKFLLQKNDNLSLACVLKSPLFNLNDEDIYYLSENINNSNLFSALNQEKYKEIHTQITKWLNMVDYKDVYELFFQILYIDKGFTKFLARLGKETIDPLSEFMNLIVKFKNMYPSNLYSFLKFITETDHSIKRDNSNKDTINLMTIHASKGLESKVVFLLNDLDSKDKDEIIIKGINNKNPLLLMKPAKEFQCQHIQEILNHNKLKQAEEVKRLLYVGITRAKEELYICSIAKNPYEQKPSENKQINNSHIWWEVLELTTNNSTITKNQDAIFEAFEDDLFINDLGFTKNYGYRITNTINAKKIKETSLISNELPIPNWLFSPTKPEPSPTKPLSPSKIDFEDKYHISPIEYLRNSKNQSSLDKGLIFHKILEQIAYIEDHQEDLIIKMLDYLGKDLSKKDQKEILNSINSIINNKEFAFLFNTKGYNEVSLSGSIFNNNELNIINARIDKLIKLETEIFVIDYKFTKQKNTMPTNYIKQMDLYKSLLKNIYQNHTIRCFIIFTKDPSIKEL